MNTLQAIHQLETRIGEHKAAQAQLIAQYQALGGAIQEAEFWLDKLHDTPEYKANLAASQAISEQLQRDYDRVAEEQEKVMQSLRPMTTEDYPDE